MNYKNCLLSLCLFIASTSLEAMNFINAAHAGNLQKVKKVLKSGVDINFQNKKGRTALSVAAEQKHADVVKYLLEQGANPSILDAKSKIAFDWVPEKGGDEIVALFEDAASKRLGKITALLKVQSSKEIVAAKIKADELAENNVDDKKPKLSLWESADQGDAQAVRWYVQNGENINAVSPGGETPLMLAAQKGNTEIVKILVDAGADLNKKDSSGNTALSVAIRKGHTPIVRLLLKADAEVNTQNDSSLTPLDIAVMRGCLDVVNVLLDHGADINFQSAYRGRSPLHWAVRMTEGSVEKMTQQNSPEVSAKVIELLLSRGANPALRDNEGKTALEWAKAFKLSKLVEALSKKPIRAKQIASVTSDYNTGSGFSSKWVVLDKKQKLNGSELVIAANGNELVSVANSGAHKIVKITKLLAAGVDINFQNKTGRTALSVAAGVGNTEAVKYLLELGADPSIRDKSNKTALDWARQMRHAETINLLESKSSRKVTDTIKTNAPVERVLDQKSILKKATPFRGTKDKKKIDTVIDWKGDDASPLIRAVGNNEIDQVKKLLLEGGDLNQKDKRGNTALAIASHKGYTPLVELLLKAGASVNVQNDTDLTPLDLAVRGGHISIANLLLEAGREGKATTLESATDRKQIAIDEGSDDISSLIRAARNNEIDQVKKLLLEGGDLNQKDKYGNTALAIASRKGYRPIIELLLKAGADVNAQNDTHLTPLDLAVIGGYISIVRLLLDHGADINFQDVEGKSALHWAVHMAQGGVEKAAIQNSSEITAQMIEFLLSRGANPDLRDNAGKTALEWARRYKLSLIVTKAFVKKPGMENRISFILPHYGIGMGLQPLVARA